MICFSFLNCADVAVNRTTVDNYNLIIQLSVQSDYQNLSFFNELILEYLFPLDYYTTIFVNCFIKHEHTTSTTYEIIS